MENYTLPQINLLSMEVWAAVKKALKLGVPRQIPLAPSVTSVS